MQYRKLGNTGLKVSEIALGSWLTFGNSVDKSQTRRIIDRAYGLGVNYFDTANVYESGEAEKAVGEALGKFPRSSYVLATKVFFPMGNEPNNKGLSRKHIFEQLHASLDRLQQDYVDIYYCHRFDPETPIEETLRTIDDMVRQGKVLYVGVSEWTAAQMTEALGVADQYLLDKIVVNQPQYNMFHRHIENEIIPLGERKGISQVVFSPLAQGVLTGKYKLGEDFPSGSRARDESANMFMDELLTQQTLKKVENLKGIADQMDISLSQLAIAWILRNPNVASAIVGATKIHQIEENAGASGITLSENVIQEIEGILEH
ncbi:aldo/keto reductase family protein [Bacillus marinisedimentorum]|uniref:aldo/keto reductase family protein n=1 Tax=Bacillus marinisedimentorum TaxID=1821260 RepID=UPI0007E28B0F|nr:aldo/keto reductase family protein [Bacillus marinisedimentorum]